MEVVRSLVFIFLLFPMVIKIAKGNPWPAWVNFTGRNKFHNLLRRNARA